MTYCFKTQHAVGNKEMPLGQLHFLTKNAKLAVSSGCFFYFVSNCSGAEKDRSCGSTVSNIFEQRL